MIKQLSKQTAQDLCAQQVVSNICDCIKQLIDNSIDAQATSIIIQLKQYGKENIKIIDNGNGIQNFQFLARKGSTSKNKGNNYVINTLGFRGQALHSLGKVSQNMTIISTTKGQHKNTIKFDVKQLKQQKMPTKYIHGTIVQIKHLFQYLPVRRYELLNKYKQFIKKTDQIIKQYCIIYPQIGFTFTNIRQGQIDALIKTNPYPKTNNEQKQKYWQLRISEILGAKIGQSLVYMKTSLLNGYILRKIQSGSSKQNSFINRNYYFMYLNKRPIDPLSKIINTLDLYYKKYNKYTKYIFVINIVLPWDTYDVNLTPNKRQILIRQTQINKICEQLKQFVEKNVIEDIPALQDYEQKIKMKQRMSNFIKSGRKSQEAINIQQQNNDDVQEIIMERKISNTKQKQTRKSQIIPNKQQLNIKQNITVSKFQPIEHKNIILSKNHTNQQRSVQKIKYLKLNQSKQKINQQQKKPIFKEEIKTSNNKNKLLQSLNQRMSTGSKKIFQNKNESIKILKQNHISKNQNSIFKSEISQIKGKDEIDKNEQQQLNKQKYERKIIVNQSNKLKKSINIIPQQNEQQSRTINIQNKFKQNIQINIQKQLKKQNKQIVTKQFSDEFLTQKTKHNLPKSAFSQFKILGQFNHGFIVCLYNESYYLVDQHAASQKYHFQKFMKSMRNKSQVCDKLYLNPIQIESIQQHRQNLQNDGYKFEISEKQGEISLYEVPIFLGKIYGKQYFLELANNKKSLEQHSDYYMAAATKACRTAVMVGDVLQFPQMTTIVRQLSSLNSPWNCPHGRPTLIYLNSKKEVENVLQFSHRQYALQ